MLRTAQKTGFLACIQLALCNGGCVQVLVMEWIDGIRCTDPDAIRTNTNVQQFIRHGVVSGLRQCVLLLPGARLLLQKEQAGWYRKQHSHQWGWQQQPGGPRYTFFAGFQGL